MFAPDLLNLDHVNLGDEFVTTFNTSFYLEYLAKWPQYCHVIISERGSIEGYSRSISSLCHLRSDMNVALPKATELLFSLNQV